MSAGARATPSASPTAPVPPRAVLFDFGGTLDADGMPSVEQFHTAYRALGGIRDAESFGAPFRASDHGLSTLGHIAQLDYTRTVQAQVALLRALLADEPAIDWDAVAARVIGAARATATRNRPVLDVLRRHTRLGVVSNFTGNVDRCLAELGLFDAFDTVADSAVVGHTKPDPEVFRVALRGLDVAPDQAMMVGDNPFADVRAATAVGMSTCWIAPRERPAVSGCAPTHRIAMLPELLTVLGLTGPAVP